MADVLLVTSEQSATIAHRHWLHAYNVTFSENMFDSRLFKNKCVSKTHTRHTGSQPLGVSLLRAVFQGRLAANLQNFASMGSVVCETRYPHHCNDTAEVSCLSWVSSFHDSFDKYTFRTGIKNKFRLAICTHFLKTVFLSYTRVFISRLCRTCKTEGFFCLHRILRKSPLANSGERNSAWFRMHVAISMVSFIAIRSAVSEILTSKVLNMLENCNQFAILGRP